MLFISLLPTAYRAWRVRIHKKMRGGRLSARAKILVIFRHPTTFDDKMAKFSIDTIFEVVEPLTGPRYSPVLLALLAHFAGPGVGDALWQFRHGVSATTGYPIALRQRVQDFLKNLFNAFFRSNAVFRIYALISITRFINRIGARFVIDRQAPRRIVWNQHCVVISGGARGIAGRTCELIKQKGALVCVIDRAPRSEHGKEDLYISADVTNEEEMLAAREKVRTELGYPTMLVSAAGIARHNFILDPVYRSSNEFSNKVIDVNLLGTIVFVRVFGQDMLSDFDEKTDEELVKSKKVNLSSHPRREGSDPIRNNWGGHILLIGSGAAFISLPANATYHASKAGVVSFYHTLGIELDTFHKTNNVRTSVLCPLMVESGMTEGRMLEQKDQFLFPTLTIEQAAKATVRLLEQDRSQIKFIPRASYALSMLSPNVPPWLVRLISKATGNAETFSDYAVKTRLAVNEK